MSSARGSLPIRPRLPCHPHLKPPELDLVKVKFRPSSPTPTVVGALLIPHWTDIPSQAPQLGPRTCPNPRVPAPAPTSSQVPACAHGALKGPDLRSQEGVQALDVGLSQEGCPPALLGAVTSSQAEGDPPSSLLLCPAQAVGCPPFSRPRAGCIHSVPARPDPAASGHLPDPEHSRNCPPDGA